MAEHQWKPCDPVVLFGKVYRWGRRGRLRLERVEPTEDTRARLVVPISTSPCALWNANMRMTLAAARGIIPPLPLA